MLGAVVADDGAGVLLCQLAAQVLITLDDGGFDLAAAKKVLKVML